jgi:hypothetical protein
MRTCLLLLLGLAGCAHVAPAITDGVPEPWPQSDPPVERKVIEPYKPPVERETKPVVPPLKPAVPVPVPPEPNTPQSWPAPPAPPSTP